MALGDTHLRPGVVVGPGGGQPPLWEPRLVALTSGLRHPVPGAAPGPAGRRCSGASWSLPRLVGRIVGLEPDID